MLLGRSKHLFKFILVSCTWFVSTGLIWVAFVIYYFFSVYFQLLTKNGDGIRLFIWLLKQMLLKPSSHRCYTIHSFSNSFLVYNSFLNRFSSCLFCWFFIDYCFCNCLITVILFKTGRAVQILLSESPYRDITIPWEPTYAADWDAADFFPLFTEFFVYKPNLLSVIASPHRVSFEICSLKVVFAS